MQKRVNTKFWVKDQDKLWNVATLYGDEAYSRSDVSEWFNRFKDGREDLQNEPRGRSHSTSRNADTTANVLETVTRDCRRALRMMADQLNISKETIREILREDSRKRRICAKFVPHRLTDEQKKRRLISFQGFVQTCQDNPSFLIAFSLS
jgi:histone-lysine N-methyltransferase SETMAR